MDGCLAELFKSFYLILVSNSIERFSGSFRDTRSDIELASVHETKEVFEDGWQHVINDNSISAGFRHARGQHSSKDWTTSCYNHFVGREEAPLNDKLEVCEVS